MVFLRKSGQSAGDFRRKSGQNKYNSMINRQLDVLIKEHYANTQNALLSFYLYRRCIRFVVRKTHLKYIDNDPHSRQNIIRRTPVVWQ